MTDRVLPEPDRYAVCPDDGGAILPFYEGVFEAAFMVLNPFIRPRSITLERYLDDPELSANEIVESCEPVRWREIQALSGLPSLGAVDIALRTSIHGLQPSNANEDFARLLRNTLHQHRLLAPTEGRFPELTRKAVLSFIRSLGHAWVWLGDELCTERKLHWLEDLTPPRATQQFSCGNCFTPDHSLLWTVHWDSHFSIICSSKVNIDKLSACPDIEGFVCKPDTRIYWSLHDAPTGA